MNVQKPTPQPEEVKIARENPGGWVYRIVGDFQEALEVPPEAVVGAWRVNEAGIIVGEFMVNPKYNQQRRSRD